MANFHLLRGRTSQVGGYYSITAVVRDRRPLLVQKNNASILRDELQRITKEGIADTLAWVAMPDHLHWLFQLRQGSLGRCMQRFKSRSARAINLGMGSSGPLWQGGYYEHCLRNEYDLLTQAR
ncbi:MAG TPA: transposase, partial [Pseudoxanthomonas sp.]|nr:transposase [Pseudoxanthomonas sp.]